MCDDIIAATELKHLSGCTSDADDWSRRWVMAAADPDFNFAALRGSLCPNDHSTPRLRNVSEFGMQLEVNRV